jgi:hypothetical protein
MPAVDRIPICGDTVAGRNIADSNRLGRLPLPDTSRTRTTEVLRVEPALKRVDDGGP